MPKLSRVIVLEGVEGSGKSTLAQMLVDKGWGYVHFAYRPYGDLLTQWTREIEEAAEKSENGRVVVDRLHVSCEVYGQLIRGEHGLSEFDFWIVDGWLAARGAVIIYLRDSWNVEATNEKLQDRFDGMIMMQDLQDKFEDVLHTVQIPVWTVDENREVAAAELDEHFLPLTSIDDGLGALKPKAWLVGDRRVGQYRTKHAVFERPGKSAIYLQKAIKVARLSWRDIHISNARDGVGYQPLLKKYAELSPKNVVSLGTIANSVLCARGIPVREVAHPKNMERYNYYDILGYAKRLRETSLNC